jgi:hypothetical protein
LVKKRNRFLQKKGKTGKAGFDILYSKKYTGRKEQEFLPAKGGIYGEKYG